MLPALLRGLVRVAAQHASDSLARRLAGVPREEWESVVLELVRGAAAGVLGRDSAQEVHPQLAFTDLGFDSLAAVELRNTLTQLTGLRLPATLVFDHPSVAAVAQLLLSRVEGVQGPRTAVDEQLDRLEAMLASVTAEGERERLGVRLRALVTATVDDGDGALSTRESSRPQRTRCSI